MPGLTLEAKQGLTRQLLHSGAAITDMNIVRRRLSAIKGGRLAQAAGPAPVVTLAISDVPGDDPPSIASGPTWPSADPPGAAGAILARYGLALPPGLAPATAIQPRPQDRFTLIATPSRSLQAAAERAHSLGITPIILGDALEGESREVGRVMSRDRAILPASCKPSCGAGGFIIRRRDDGDHRRHNARARWPQYEFLLALALQLSASAALRDRRASISALACDTDGIDGTEDAAGAIVTEIRLPARGRAAGCPRLSGRP